MNKEDFMELDDDMKWRAYLNELATNGKLRSGIDTRTAQIRHFRIRIKKISNSLDYLLQHPFSIDNSNMTKPHKRDKR